MGMGMNLFMVVNLYIGVFGCPVILILEIWMDKCNVDGGENGLVEFC